MSFFSSESAQSLCVTGQSGRRHVLLFEQITELVSIYSRGNHNYSKLHNKQL